MSLLLRQKEKCVYGLRDTAARVIGVMGVCRGAGATHMSLMLANSLANGVKAKTAVVEYNEHNQYLEIYKEVKSDDVSMKRFSYCGVDFYRNIREEELSEIIADKYDYVIMDMQYEQPFAMKELLRSDVRIIVAGLNLWQIGAFKTFLKNEHKCLDLYRFTAHCCNAEFAKAIYKEYCVKVKEIPTELNPFKISSQGFYVILHLAGLL